MFLYFSVKCSFNETLIKSEIEAVYNEKLILFSKAGLGQTDLLFLSTLEYNALSLKNLNGS